jgi:hypothetical protein
MISDGESGGDGEKTILPDAIKPGGKPVAEGESLEASLLMAVLADAHRNGSDVTKLTADQVSRRQLTKLIAVFTVSCQNLVPPPSVE